MNSIVGSPMKSLNDPMDFFRLDGSMGSADFGISDYSLQKSASSEEMSDRLFDSWFSNASSSFEDDRVRSLPIKMLTERSEPRRSSNSGTPSAYYEYESHTGTLRSVENEPSFIRLNGRPTRPENSTGGFRFEREARKLGQRGPLIQEMHQVPSFQSKNLPHYPAPPQQRFVTNIRPEQMRPYLRFRDPLENGLRGVAFPRVSTRSEYVSEERRMSIPPSPRSSEEIRQEHRIEHRQEHNGRLSKSHSPRNLTSPRSLTIPERSHPQHERRPVNVQDRVLARRIPPEALMALHQMKNTKTRPFPLLSFPQPRPTTPEEHRNEMDYWLVDHLVDMGKLSSPNRYRAESNSPTKGQMPGPLFTTNPMKGIPMSSPRSTPPSSRSSPTEELIDSRDWNEKAIYLQSLLANGRQDNRAFGNLIDASNFNLEEEDLCETQEQIEMRQKFCRHLGTRKMRYASIAKSRNTKMKSQSISVSNSNKKKRRYSQDRKERHGRQNSSSGKLTQQFRADLRIDLKSLLQSCKHYAKHDRWYLRGHSKFSSVIVVLDIMVTYKKQNRQMCKDFIKRKFELLLGKGSVVKVTLVEHKHIGYVKVRDPAMVQAILFQYEKYGLSQELKTFPKPSLQKKDLVQNHLSDKKRRPLKRNAVKLFIETTKHLSHRGQGLWLKKCDTSRAKQFDTSNAIYVLNIKSSVEDKKLHEVFSTLGEVTGLKSKPVSRACQLAFIYFKTQEQVDAVMKQYKACRLHLESSPGEKGNTTN